MKYNQSIYNTLSLLSMVEKMLIENKTVSNINDAKKLAIKLIEDIP